MRTHQYSTAVGGNRRAADPYTSPTNDRRVRQHRRKTVQQRRAVTDHTLDSIADLRLGSLTSWTWMPPFPGSRCA
jgi:hypothetical protein